MSSRRLSIVGQSNADKQLDRLKKEILEGMPPGVTILHKSVEALKTPEEAKLYIEKLIRDYRSSDWTSWFPEYLNETQFNTLQKFHKHQGEKFKEYQEKYKNYPETKLFTSLYQYLAFENDLLNPNNSKAANVNLTCSVKPSLRNKAAYNKYQRNCVPAITRGGKRKGKKMRRTTRRRR